MLVRILAAVFCAAVGLLGILAIFRARAKALEKTDPEERIVLAVLAHTARLLIAIAMASAMLLVGLLLFIRSELGGHDVCELAQAAIVDLAHQQVYIGHCKLDPIQTRVVIDDVRVGPPNKVFFTADRLAAGLDTAGVLSGRLKLDRLVIDKPRVQLDVSKPSTKPKGPKRPPGAACLPDLSGFSLGSINIHDGSFHVLLPGERGLALEGLGAAIVGDGDALDVDLSAARTTLADATGATTATTTAVRGSFDLVHGTAQVQRVELAGDAGAVTVSGTLSSICALDGTATGDVQLDLGLLHNHLLRAVPNLSGIVRVHTDAQLAGKNFDAKIKADVEDSSIAQFEPGTFSIEAKANPKRVTVEKVTVPFEHGKVIGKGTVELTSPYELDASATLDGFSLGELLERLGVPGLPVHVLGSGTANIAGPLVTKEGIDLSGSLDMKVHEFGVYSRSWRRRASRGTVRYAGFTDGALKTDYHLTQRQIDLANTRITTHGSDIGVEGTVYFQVENGLDLRFDAQRVSVGDVSPFAGVTVQGQGIAQGSITGPYHGLDIRGDVELESTRVLGYELGDVTGSVDLDLAAGMLTATDVQAEKGDSYYSGNGRMSFRGGVLMDARAQVDDANLSDLLAIARVNYPVLDRISRQVKATLTGDVELSGLAARPTIETQLKLGAVNVAGQSFDGGILRARMTEAREVEVSSLKLNRGKAQVSGTAWYRFADKAYRVRAASHGVLVHDVDALVSAVPKLKGAVAFNLTGEGTLEYPQAKAYVKLTDWFLGDQPLATAAADLTLDGRILSLVNGEIVSPWPDGTRSPPRMPDEPLPRPPRSMSAGIGATVTLSDDMPYTFTSNFDVSDLSVLMRPGAMAGAKANLTGRVEAAGQLAKFLTSTSATLTLERLGATIAGRTVENAEQAKAVLAGGVLTVDSFPLKGTLFDMDASGTWTLVNAAGGLDLGGPKNVALTGAMDLGILKSLLPTLELDESKGRVSVNVDVKAGDRSSKGNVAGGVGEVLASINSTAELKDVALRVHNLPVALSDGNGTVVGRFQLTRLPDGTVGVGDNGGLISVEGVDARLNDTGELHISGDLHTDQHTIRDGDLVLAIDGVPVRLDEDVTLTVSGRPEFIRRELTQRDDTAASPAARPVVVQPVRAEEWENKLGGTLEVTRFRYTHDLELERAVANLLNFSRRPPAPKVFSKKGAFLDLDVGISFGDVQVSNNLLKARFDASNLRLTGTNLRPGLMGSVSVAEGKAHVYNSDFIVSSCVFNFTDPYSYSNPVIALRADTVMTHEQQEYNIHFSWNGTLQDKRIEYWSEPSLSGADIVELLAVGTTSTDLERAGGTTALWGGLADKVVRATGLAQQLRKILPDNNVIRDVQVHVSSDYIEQTGTVDPVAQGELKVFNDNWTLRGQTSLLAARGRKAELDAKLFKHVDGELQWNGDKPTAPSSGDVGLDARLHWEKQ